LDDARGDDCTEQPGGRGDGEHCADRSSGRVCLLLGGDDEDERDAGEEQVPGAAGQRECTQRGLIPDEAKTFARLFDRALTFALALRAERRTDQRERDDRGEVGRRVGEKRDRASELKEGTADGRAEEVGGAEDDGVLRAGGRKL